MPGIIIHGQEREVPSELNLQNFHDPSVFRFRNQPRTPARVDAVVVHETVTTSWATTVAVLKQRDLGVHFIADPNGTVYQHADLLDDEMWHASQFNSLSVGIETVNPYDPKYLPKGAPWTHVIDAPWAAGGKYVVPTAAQSEAVCQLLNFLTSAAAAPLAIPKLWVGLQQTQTLAMGRIPADLHENPGIHAHMYFGHADGAWLVLYAWLRLEILLPAEIAYAEAIRLAAGARPSGVDLSQYFASNPYLQTGEPPRASQTETAQRAT